MGPRRRRLRPDRRDAAAAGAARGAGLAPRATAPGPARADPHAASRGRRGGRVCRCPTAAVVEAVTGWHRQMRDVHRILTGDQTSVRLVLTPERVVIAESRRTWTSLSLYGFVVDARRRQPGLPGGRGRRGATPDAWRVLERGAAGRARRGPSSRSPGCRSCVTPYLPSEPIGADALADLAAEAQDVAAPTSRSALLGPVRHHGLRVRRSGSGYVLSLPLPLAHAADLGLQAPRRRAGRHGGRAPPGAHPARGSATMRGRGCRRARRTAAGALRPRRGGVAACLRRTACGRHGG